MIDNDTLRARIAELEKDRPEVVTVDELSVWVAEAISRNTKPVDYCEIGNAPAEQLLKIYPNGIKIVQDKEGG